jgi:hypothetical protein
MMTEHHPCIEIDLLDADAWRAIAIGLLVLSIARPILRIAGIVLICLAVIWML